ncbi:MAG: hypothetical protein E6R03_17325 [Hyphomicrobiaceae bacterium]|nr:hypothetical protein [Anaerolineae bacterium]TXH09014.1 MAG: hypothetical protein E6R03_17325 [Hyphomicrobiaceae bacterium]
MARSVLDVIINLKKQGSADEQAVKGLVQVKRAITDAAAVAGGLVAAGYAVKKIWEQTGGVAVEYANKVREITDVSRLSAEESSKLIQLTDDYKVSQEDLLKIMQKNGDVYDYSIQGLAGMSDAYNDLTTKEEKANFMQERFGKNWGSFVELMEQGSDKIIAAGEGINKALILDEAALKSAREYEKQLDSLNDTADAVKISVGTKMVPAFTDLLEVIQMQVDDGLNWKDFIPPLVIIDNLKKWNEATRDSNSLQERANQIMIGGAARNREEALTMAAAAIEIDKASTARMNGLASLYANTDATKANTAATEADAEAIKAASDANREFLSTLGSVNSTYQSYMETTKSLEQERIELEKEKQGLIAQGYSEQSTQIQEVNAKIAENQQQTTAAADQFELDNKRILLGYLERKLTADGILDDKELIWLTEKGVAWGVYHQTAVAETQAMINEANGLIEGLITEKTFTLSLNTIYSQAGNSTQNNVYGNGSRNAAGTHGFEPVPAGHPTDTFAIMANSNEEYFVRDKGATSMAGGMSGGAVNVTINFNSVVNTADREKAKGALEPIIFDAIRKARAQGRV